MFEQNREKLTPPLVRKISALAQRPPPCQCGHIINFEKPDVFARKSKNIDKAKTSTSEETHPS